MARELAPVEINTFVGGLVTDAGPLTFPDNSSILEDNFILNEDGSRKRRLGIDFERGSQSIQIGADISNSFSNTSFTWENAGDNPDRELLVVQFGNELRIFDLEESPISNNHLYTYTIEDAAKTEPFSYAVADGLLIVATGLKELYIFTFDTSDDSFTVTTDHLTTRDLWGVESVISDVDYRDPDNIATRPTAINDQYFYNLRNQGWGISRVPSNAEYLQDPIQHFLDVGVVPRPYPSNADSVTQALYADSSDTDNRHVLRFFGNDLESNPVGNVHTAVGHFIVDALDRGAGRVAAIENMKSIYSDITLGDTDDIPVDRTPGGPTVIGQFAGRVFYSGFNGTLVGGDKHSPKLGSYVFFSRLVNNSSDITRCYQDGDPTSLENTDLIDTDGGFIRIDDAYGIVALIEVGISLLVIAANGVWRIVGGDETGFRATSYQVSKVSERGCRSPKSVVNAEGSILYWGDDGIYSITRNQFGDWGTDSLTQGRIQKFYNKISSEDVISCQGYYDSYDKKVRWVYQTTFNDFKDTKELILDVRLNAFYTNTIKTPEGSLLPKIVGIFGSSRFSSTIFRQRVTTDSGTVNTELDSEVQDVIVEINDDVGTVRQALYIVVDDTNPRIGYRFAEYRDNDFLDWKSFDGVGLDAPAEMITGYISGGDFQRQKQVPVMTAYMRKTETGFYELDGAIVAENESSCLVQFQWAWTNDISSNRWSREFEIYRHRRLYIPVNLEDRWDDGQEIVISKNKIRGKGNVLSIAFKSQPGKDCHIYGWSLILGIMTDV